MLSLTLCGRVLVTGETVLPAAAGLSAKSLALLAYLALEPGPHSREEIAALLWGEYPDDKAKASLRQAVLHLRDALSGSFRITRGSIELIGPVECDVTSFLRLAKESSRGAADRIGGEFLDGLPLRRCPAFDEWADGIRATLARRLGEVLAAVSREALATRQWQEAVRFSQQWVSVAPISAPANSALIEAHFMTGDRDAALDAFGQYRTALGTEAGAPLPDQSIIDLVERIRGTPPTSARRQATEEWYAAAPSFQGSLVGREREWEGLARAWAKSAGGRSRVVLVEGDAGVGKTRLATDFLRWVTAEGGTVLRGRAYDVRGGVPFGAMVEAIRSGIDAPGLAGTDPQWLAEVARLVPELRTRFRSLSPAAPTSAADGWRLFEGVAQLIGALAEEAPVAILINDLQWCDADSCTLLHALIRKLGAAPVLWCLTFSPGSAERDAPASRLVRALRAFSQTDALALRPLGEDAVWHLLHGLGQVRESEITRRLAARIHEVTTGYPFYVIELLKTLFAQGVLAVDPETGEWIVRAEDGADMLAFTSAPSVHEAISERIECLPDELASVLISIVLATRGCRADVLSHVHGISRLRAAIAGDALVERHLAVEEDGVYRCAHPVIARVVSDAIGTSRRREVHRGLALALEVVAAAGGSVMDPAAIARHAEQGGERAMAYRYAMQAAAVSEERFAYDEALTWLDFAAGSASGAADADAVNQTTARLLASSGGEFPVPSSQFPVPGS